MKRIALLYLVLLTAGIISCGVTPMKINGSYVASLLNPDGTAAYTFATTLTQASGSAVSVSGFAFSSSAPCFNAPMGQTATFSATGSSHGYQIGPFAMTVTTALGPPVENVLTLSGSRNNDGRISGTWSLTGLTDCTGSGSFTMGPQPPIL